MGALRNSISWSLREEHLVWLLLGAAALIAPALTIVYSHLNDVLFLLGSVAALLLLGFYTLYCLCQPTGRRFLRLGVLIVLCGLVWSGTVELGAFLDSQTRRNAELIAQALLRHRDARGEFPLYLSELVGEELKELPPVLFVGSRWRYLPSRRYLPESDHQDFALSYGGSLRALHSDLVWYSNVR